MSFNPASLQKGVVFKLNGQIYTSLGYQRRVSARQRSTGSIKAKEITTNKLIELRLKGNEAISLIDAQRQSVNFLYADNNQAYFMDPTDYHQYHLPVAELVDKLPLLGANQKVILILTSDQPLTIELPNTVCLEVSQAERAVRGDTTTNVLKQATLTTGLRLKVPAFIKPGDWVVVDTQTGKYINRQTANDQNQAWSLPGWVESSSQSSPGNWFNPAPTGPSGRQGNHQTGFRINPRLRRLVVVKDGRNYVSRGGDKLATANNHLRISFVDKIVLDVGCSAGGFSDYALQNQARLVIGVDVGTQVPDQQLSAKSNFHFFAKTDIRHFIWPSEIPAPDLILVDVAFISLTKVLPAIAGLCQPQTELIVLAKPQFEQKTPPTTVRLKNNRHRRQILLGVETYFKANNWSVITKLDSPIRGLKGNQERFYQLKKL